MFNHCRRKLLCVISFTYKTESLKQSELVRILKWKLIVALLLHLKFFVQFNGFDILNKVFFFKKSVFPLFFFLQLTKVPYMYFITEQRYSSWLYTEKSKRIFNLISDCNPPSLKLLSFTKNSNVLYLVEQWKVNTFGVKKKRKSPKIYFLLFPDLWTNNLL